MSNTILATEIPGAELVSRGKVRDMYAAGDKLIIVATDRISAFDVVLPTGIPHKGAVLTGLSLFWFELLGVNNHLVTADIEKYPEPFSRYRDQLESRSMLVKRAEVVPIECVARGYLSGSGWKEYKTTGEVCGIKLPAGLKESDKLPEPIFTPATKEQSGHDINISEEVMAGMVGAELTRELKELTLSIYSRAASYARDKGIIIADTKFEFGKFDGGIILIDEALTPDSSRFWPSKSYTPGQPQQSFDKQYVRDYLETLEWDKSPPGPKLPQEVVEHTSEKYLEAYRLLTGRELAISPGNQIRNQASH
ncbi:MAG TPA: phosphoribosylaminoimidazolesuccinocarboxamide synthase [Blastocatellia bacterium]|nr:phosphoribosylaminoimidazolesuccinocarboxamide synthase [Blastocatellia bacterium]